MYRDVKETMEKYNLSDPWQIVDLFENKIAEYTGAPYAVSVDNCTNALFLCLKYLKATGEIEVPKKTYLSVPGLIIHANCTPKFVDLEWDGCYQLKPYPIWDSATRLTKGMYQAGTFTCLSFHIKKVLPIGKGGMILLDNKESIDWFRRMRYEGRNNLEPHDSIEDIELLGYNFYMEPERAARGLELFENLPEVNPDFGGSWKYKNLSGYTAFKI